MMKHKGVCFMRVPNMLYIRFQILASLIFCKEFQALSAVFGSHFFLEYTIFCLLVVVVRFSSI